MKIQQSRQLSRNLFTIVPYRDIALVFVSAII